MANSKLINRNTMNKPSTRSIGINTDTNFPNIKCVKCLQECSKIPIFPWYFPVPYPVCNCMIFSHFQNNQLDYLNASCKCDNKNYINWGNFHHCMPNYSSSTSSCCQNCGSKTSCNASESIHQTISNEIVDNSEEKDGEKLKVSLRSSMRSLKKENLEKDVPNQIEEIDNSNITKYAAEFLEKNYRSNYKSKSNEEQIKDNTTGQNGNHSNEKQLLTHLLKPNTGNNKANIVENDDSDDSIESDNDENISEDDDFSGKTVINASKIDLNKDRPKSTDDRRPARININTTHSQNSFKRTQSQPRNADVEMLMMIKALVNNQYDNNNSQPLNKLLNQIGSESGGPKVETKKAASPSPRRKVTNKNYSNLIPKLNDNKKP